MPALHVVFDTNVYRQLSPDSAQFLQERECTQSVTALAGFGPALELAAHLGDEGDPAFHPA
jgi:hypothetical protein